MELNELDKLEGETAEIQKGIIYISENSLNDTLSKEIYRFLSQKENINLYLIFQNKDIKEAFEQGNIINNKFTFIEYLSYNEDYKELDNFIWKDEQFRFLPMQTKDIQGEKLQIIEGQILGEQYLATSFLTNWNFNIDKFIDTSSAQNDETKPIKQKYPVALFNIRINWLVIYLTVSLKNNCEIYVWTTNKDRESIYVCSHSNKNLGKILK